MARELREVVERIQYILGFKIEIVERAGTPLKLMFPLSRIGQGGECGREDCITCTQESRGEVLPPCNKRSVLYENICLKCNPEAGGESKEEINPPLDHPSIYVGETARSLYERGKEHWRGFRNQEEDSHINKHHQLHHGGEGAPSFHLRPARFFTAALTRQIAEAVRIERWGEQVVLNSKAEYNRCKISRLTLGEEEQSRDKVGLEDANEKEEIIIKDWERIKLRSRRTDELQGRVDLGRGIARSPERKRGGNSKESSSSNEAVKKTKKRKYPIIGEDHPPIVTTPNP